MTGPYAEYGQQFKTGIEVALDEVGWKVAGRPIELIIEDDKSTDTAVGLDKTRKLIDSDKIDIMIGPLMAGIRLAVEPYIEEKEIPNFTISRHLAKAATEGNCVFLMHGTIEHFLIPQGWGAYEYGGYRTANTITHDFVAGHLYMGGIIEGFQEKGGTIVSEQRVPLPTEDFAPYVLTLKDADVVMTWLAGVDSLTFLTSFFDLGYDKKMKVIISLGDEFLRDENIAVYGDKALGILGVTNYNWRIDTPVNKEFVKTVEAKIGEKPGPFTVRAYESTATAIAALEATKGDATIEKMRPAILGIKTDFPSGPLSFTSNGLGIRNIYIVEVQKIEGEYGWGIVKAYPEFSVE